MRTALRYTFCFSTYCAVLFIVSSACNTAFADEREESAFVEPLPEGAISRLGAVRFRAAGQLAWVKLSADGRTLATINVSQLLRVWDTRNGQLVLEKPHYQLPQQSMPGAQVVLSHDTKTAAFVENARIVLRRCDNFEPLPWALKEHLRFESEFVGFSSDDQAIIFAYADGPKAYSIKTGRELPDFKVPEVFSAKLPHSSALRTMDEVRAVGEYWTKIGLNADNFKRIEFLSLSADRQLLAVGDRFGGNRIRLFRISKNGEGTLTVDEHLPDDGHEAGIVCLHYLGTSGRLLTTSIDNSGRVWDVKTGRPTLRIERAYQASVSANGARVAVSGLNSGDIRVFDMGMSEESQKLSARPGTGAIALSPTGRHLAYTASGLNIEELYTGKISLIQKDLISSYTMQFSRDGALIALGDSRPRVWNVATGELALDAKSGSPHVLVLSPDNKQLVTAANQGAESIQVWDISTGKLAREFRVDARLKCGAMMRDNRRLIGGCLDGKIRVWDIETGRVLTTLPGHRSYVMAIALSPDETQFASGCIDSETLIWPADKLPKPAD